MMIVTLVPHRRHVVPHPSPIVRGCDSMRGRAMMVLVRGGVRSRRGIRGHRHGVMMVRLRHRRPAGAKRYERRKRQDTPGDILECHSPSQLRWVRCFDLARVCITRRWRSRGGLLEAEGRSEDEGRVGTSQGCARGSKVFPHRNAIARRIHGGDRIEGGPGARRLLSRGNDAGSLGGRIGRLEPAAGGCRDRRRVPGHPAELAHAAEGDARCPHRAMAAGRHERCCLRKEQRSQNHRYGEVSFHAALRFIAT